MEEDDPYGQRGWDETDYMMSESVATSSLMSQRSVESVPLRTSARPASATPYYNSRTNGGSMQKLNGGGTLPRSRTSFSNNSSGSHSRRRSTYGTLERGGTLDRGGGTLRRSQNSFNDQQQYYFKQKSESHSSLSSKPILRNGSAHNLEQSRGFQETSRNGYGNPDQVRKFSEGVNSSGSSLRQKDPGLAKSRPDYPDLPRSSSTVQIVAKSQRPCCGLPCLNNRRTSLSRAQRSSHGAANNRQPVSICMLFSIFLAFSLVIISGIMLYLRGGE